MASVEKSTDQRTGGTSHIATPILNSQQGSSTSLPVIRSSMGRRQLHRRALVLPVVRARLPPLHPTLILGLNKWVGQRRMIATAEALLSVRWV